MTILPCLFYGQPRLFREMLTKNWITLSSFDLVSSNGISFDLIPRNKANINEAFSNKPGGNSGFF